MATGEKSSSTDFERWLVEQGVPKASVSTYTHLAGVLVKLSKGDMSAEGMSRAIAEFEKSDEDAELAVALKKIAVALEEFQKTRQ